MSSEKPLHIISLTAENVKRLQAVTVRPNGDVVLIGGANAQGKTSLLDSIEMALGGGKTIPVEPVRRGARKGRIVVDLGELVVERTFTPKGTALEVRSAEGVPFKSPQSLLDKLCSKVAFDPLGFAREDPKKQDEILRQVLDIDFTDLDTRREALFAKRRDAKRDAKTLSARIGAMICHSDVPAEEVSITALTKKFEQMRDQEGENSRIRERLNMAKRELDITDDRMAANEERILELREELEAAEGLSTQLRSKRVKQSLEFAACKQAVDALVRTDTTTVLEQIAKAEDTNRKIRENAERSCIVEQLNKLESDIDNLTVAIDDIDASKEQTLADAKFPVEGLGFDDTGPTLNGIPLSQCSQAERLRVSVAIGAALKPRVKVMLVRDGSLLDDQGMTLLAQLAHETGSQLWVERVGDRDASAVIIEDGMISTK